MEGRRGAVRPDGRGYAVAVALLTSCTFVVTLAWGLLLPHFDGPDELFHHNSVARLVDGGGWPEAYDASVLESTWQAVRESGGEDPDGGRAVPVPEPEDYSALLAEPSVPSDTPDFMLQHPPAYYASAAVAVGAVGGGDLRWDHAQAVMRGVSALWIAVAVPFLVGVVRWATGSRAAALAGGAAPLAVPFLTNSGAYVSNDTLLVAACSATLYLLVRAWRDPAAPAWLAPAAGLAYGVALLTKGFALFLGPVFVLLVVLAALARSRSAGGVLARVAVPGVVAAAVGGWWWVRNYLVLGTVQPSRLGARERATEPVDGYSLTGFLEGALDRLNVTFWGRGGRPEVALPETLTLVLLLVLVVLVVLAATHRRARAVLLVLALYPLAIAVTVIRNAHGIYYDTGRPFQGVQGRYLYSGIAVLAVAAGASVHLLLARVGDRVRGLLTAAGTVVPVVLGVVALTWTVERTWSARGATGWALRSGPDVSSAVLALLAAVLVLLLVGLGVLAARVGRERPSPDL